MQLNIARENNDTSQTGICFWCDAKTETRSWYGRQQVKDTNMYGIIVHDYISLGLY